MNDQDRAFFRAANAANSYAHVSWYMVLLRVTATLKG